MRENEKLLLLQDYKVNKHLFDKFGIDYDKLLNKPDLSTVATTGDYEDLLNKPDFPDLSDLSTVATTGSYDDLIDKPVLAIATTTANGLMSSADKTKLDGVKAGANKVANSTTNGNILIDNVETKVYTHPTGTNPHGTTKSDVGLSNVDNTKDLNKPISTATQTALNDKISTSQKGVSNGIAQLNENGVVPSSQLPSYVDDVLEYSSNALFPAIGESGKIYINTTTNLTYRWTGNGYAKVSPSIALGETSSTAYAGDKGKATTDKVNGHTGNASNPHSVTKAQVGLSNVPNVATNSQTPTYTVASTNTALASGEVLSAAFGKIAKAVNSLISHLADKVSHITSTERTNWNSKATQSDIDTSINAIQIGGRNLLKNTSIAKDLAGWVLTHNGITRDTTFLNNGTNTFKYNISGLINDSWYSVRQSTPLGGTAGQQYTASCEVCVPLVNGIDRDVALEIIYNNSAGTRIGSETAYVNKSTTNSWQKLTITGTAPTGTTDVMVWVWCQRNGHFWMSHPKLEKGNKATDWTPAPEDVGSAIALKADKTTSGTTATRPIPTHIGQAHFDTTLGKPIWCKTVETPVWVDSIGIVV